VRECERILSKRKIFNVSKYLRGIKVSECESGSPTRRKLPSRGAVKKEVDEVGSFYAFIAFSC